MPNLILGQDVANKRQRKLTVAKSFIQPIKLWRYGSLININPSGRVLLSSHCYGNYYHA